MNLYGAVLAESWMNEPPRAKAFATRLRFSQAGHPSRQIAYQLMGVAETNPPSISDAWVMGLGTLVHAAWQQAILGDLNRPLVLAEKKVKHPTLDASGHLDLYIDDRLYVEGKTVSGQRFRRIVGAPTHPGGKPPQQQGPLHGHRRQLALGVHSTNANEGRLTYLAMEALAKDVAYGPDRFCAEYSFSREELATDFTDETTRLQEILDTVDNGVLPRCEHEWRYPDGFKRWPCQYCPFQTRCQQDGPNEKKMTP